MTTTTEQGLGQHAHETVETMPPLAPRLLSVPEAARLLGIGRTTTYELISNGELETVKIGRSTRVPLEAVDAFVIRLRHGRAKTR